MVDNDRNQIKLCRGNEAVDAETQDLQFENQAGGLLDKLKTAVKDLFDIGADIGKKLSDLLNSVESRYTFDKYLEILSDKTDEHILDFQNKSNCFYIGGNIILKIDDENGKMNFNFDGYFNETKDGKGAWHKLSFSGNTLLSRFEDPNEPQMQEIRQKVSEGGMKYPVIL